MVLHITEPKVLLTRLICSLPVVDDVADSLVVVVVVEVVVEVVDVAVAVAAAVVAAAAAAAVVASARGSIDCSIALTRPTSSRRRYRARSMKWTPFHEITPPPFLRSWRWEQSAPGAHGAIVPTQKKSRKMMRPSLP